MAQLTEKDIQEIIKLFDYELNLLIRMDRFEKMALRKKINDIAVPLLNMEHTRATILMDIMEDKLHDVFDTFVDGYEFRMKLKRLLSDKLKS